MTYNPLIPQGTDNLSTSQDQILINFGQLNTLYGDATHDHYAFNDATLAYRGHHKSIQFPVVTANPGIATPNGSVFTKTESAKTQLFFQNGAAATDVYQITSDVHVWTPELSTTAGVVFTYATAIISRAYWMRMGRGVYVWGRYCTTGALTIVIPVAPNNTYFIGNLNGVGTNPPQPTGAFQIDALDQFSGGAPWHLGYLLTAVGPRAQFYSARTGNPSTLTTATAAGPEISFQGYYE